MARLFCFREYLAKLYDFSSSGPAAAINIVKTAQPVIAANVMRLPLTMGVAKGILKYIVASRREQTTVVNTAFEAAANARTTNHHDAHSIASTAIRVGSNTATRPQNPASGGMPDRLNRNKAMAAAVQGRLRPSPANSSTSFISPSLRPR